MDVERALRLTNRNMIVFDLVLGSAALLAPASTLAVLGHDRPSTDAEHLFRRCGPIWLTFAVAHVVADRRRSEHEVEGDHVAVGEPQSALDIHGSDPTTLRRHMPLAPSANAGS